MPSTPVFTSSESQRRWREHMKHNYSVDHDFSPCVFEVPDNLKETNTEAYTPQLLGLGPYHHFRPQVQPMEREKRAAIRRTLNGLRIREFIDLPEITPDDFEPTIRSCYDSYLDLDKETLAWLFLVDGLYLLELMGLRIDGVEQKGNEALYAELLMLENQIPIVLIQESFKLLFFILDDKFINRFNDGEIFFSPCKNFSKKWSPLKLTESEGTQKEAYDTKKHLLNYMYQMIVKTKTDNNNNNNNPEERNHDNNNNNNNNNNNPEERNQDNNNNNNWVLGIAREAASQGREIIKEAIDVFNSSLSDAKSAGIKVPGNVDTVSNILRNFQKVLDLHHKKLTSGDDQIDIPSASRLKAILKITFRACCGIGDITLVKNGRTSLYLPVITLRPSSEVILRNLAAYEQIAKMESTPIKAYLELMGGLVKSEKDVELLRGEKIIQVEQLSNKEIVRMFNGFNGFKKSAERPDEKSNNKVHETIEGVKDQFGQVGIVKACRSIMKSFAGCVKFFQPLFPVLVLLFLAFQSFCEIYGCRRRGSPYGGATLHGELDPNARLMLPRKVYRY